MSILLKLTITIKGENDYVIPVWNDIVKLSQTHQDTLQVNCKLEEDKPKEAKKPKYVQGSIDPFE